MFIFFFMTTSANIEHWKSANGFYHGLQINHLLMHSEREETQTSAVTK